MSAFITPQGNGLFAIKERVDGEVRPVADHFSFDDAKAALRIYSADGVDGLDEFCQRLDQEHYDEQEAGMVYCSICDGVGHGQPGYGPCPLEERGWAEALMDEEMEARMGVIPFDVAMRQAGQEAAEQAATEDEPCGCTGVGLTMCSAHASDYQRRYGRAHNE